MVKYKVIFAFFIFCHTKWYSGLSPASESFLGVCYLSRRKIGPWLTLCSEIFHNICLNMFCSWLGCLKASYSAYFLFYFSAYILYNINTEVYNVFHDDFLQVVNILAHIPPPLSPSLYDCLQLSQSPLKPSLIAGQL